VLVSNIEAEADSEVVDAGRLELNVELVFSCTLSETLASALRYADLCP